MSEPIPVILNAAAGKGYRPEDIQQLAELFRAAGAEVRIFLARRGSRVARLARRVMQRQPEVIVAGGGDGTVSSVAAEVVSTGTALGILPLGTLNHFAKDVGIPLELPDAVRTIAARRVHRVDVGEVNDRIFINNSSLGLYPYIVRHRELLRRRLGAGKWAAAVWATLTVMRRRPFLTVELRVDDEQRSYRTPLVFIGNNAYVIEGFNLGRRERLDAGILDVYVIRRPSRLALLSLAVRALFGRLQQAEDFESHMTQSVEVATRRQRVPVAIDGEVRTLETPLQYRIRAGELRVIVPGEAGAGT
ncbi:MAG: diacylglycerol kinase family protein [Candidatus Binatia bacterium]